jgi:hypothetical protein
MLDAPVVRSDSARVTAVLLARDAPIDLLPILLNLPECVAEVIIVGDARTPASRELADATQAHVRIVERAGSEDEGAFARGFAAADGEIVVMLEHASDTSRLERFVTALEHGANFVSAAGTPAEEEKRSLA